MLKIDWGRIMQLHYDCPVHSAAYFPLWCVEEAQRCTSAVHTAAAIQLCAHCTLHMSLSNIHVCYGCGIVCTFCESYKPNQTIYHFAVDKSSEVWQTLYGFTHTFHIRSDAVVSLYLPIKTSNMTNSHPTHSAFWKKVDDYPAYD